MTKITETQRKHFRYFIKQLLCNKNFT